MRFRWGNLSKVSSNSSTFPRSLMSIGHPCSEPLKLLLSNPIKLLRLPLSPLHKRHLSPQPVESSWQRRLLRNLQCLERIEADPLLLKCLCGLNDFLT